MPTTDPDQIARRRRAAALLTALGSAALVALTVGGGALTAAGCVWLARHEVPGPWWEVFNGVLVTGFGLAVTQTLLGGFVAWTVWSSERSPVQVWGDLSWLILAVIPIALGCFVVPFGGWAGANAAFGLGGAWLAWREQRSLGGPLQILTVAAVGFGPIGASQWLHSFAHSMTVPLMVGAVYATLGLQLAVAQVLATLSRELPLLVLRPAALGRHALACQRLEQLRRWVPDLERRAPEILHRSGRSREVLRLLDRRIERPLSPTAEAAARTDRAWTLLDLERTDGLDGELQRIVALGGDPKSLAAVLAIHTGTVDEQGLIVLKGRIDEHLPRRTARLVGADRRPEYRADLAWALAVHGESATARSELDQVLAGLDPRFGGTAARVLWRLGNAAKALHEPQLAHTLWVRGAELDPGQAGRQCRLRSGTRDRTPGVGTGAVATA